ncbi:UMP-CMP kinase 3-like isoform X2 [Punica granatum]|uniref:adenylate kinase n=2 Tax=Punica granatum TaxID=22663 RepID=A0A6P8DF52_PUNGR|nr:UMP-CMP kinase 3-like isoform X2 [Punica granatum]
MELPGAAKTEDHVPPSKEANEQLSKGYTVVYVLGCPGSGKSTQCSKISAGLGFFHLSAGDLLQEEINSGSEDGIQIGFSMCSDAFFWWLIVFARKMIADLKREGRLVPSEIVVKLLQQAMQRTGNKKSLIDGFPRNEENQNIIKIEPELVLLLDCSEEESTRRLLNRNQGRVDDNAETIKKRFKVYSESTLPVINYYSSNGKLRRIDAERPIEEVYESVKEILSELEQKHQGH